MAINNLESVQIATIRGSRSRRLLSFNETQTKIQSAYAQIGTVPGVDYNEGNAPEAVVASDAGSTIDLLKLPYGSIRLLPYKLAFRTSLVGNFKFGIRQYTSGDNIIIEQSDVTTNGAGGITTTASNVVTVGGTILDYNIASNAGVVLFVEFDGAITASDWFEVRAEFLSLM